MIPLTLEIYKQFIANHIRQLKEPELTTVFKRGTKAFETYDVNMELIDSQVVYYVFAPRKERIDRSKRTQTPGELAWMDVEGVGYGWLYLENNHKKRRFLQRELLKDVRAGIPHQYYKFEDGSALLIFSWYVDTKTNTIQTEAQDDYDEIEFVTYWFASPRKKADGN